MKDDILNMWNMAMLISFLLRVVGSFRFNDSISPKYIIYLGDEENE